MDERSIRSEPNREQNGKDQEFTIDWLGRKRFHPTPGVFFSQAAYEEYSIFHNPSPPSGLESSGTPQVSPKAGRRDAEKEHYAQQQHTLSRSSENTSAEIVKGKKKTPKSGPPEKTTVDNNKRETILPRNVVASPTSISVNLNGQAIELPRKRKRASTTPSVSEIVAPSTSLSSSNRAKSVEPAPISEKIVPFTINTTTTPSLIQKSELELLLSQPSEKNEIQQPSLHLDLDDFPDIENFYNDDTSYMDDSMFHFNEIPDDANVTVETPETISSMPLSGSPSLGAEVVDFETAAHSQLTEMNPITTHIDKPDRSQIAVQGLSKDNSPKKDISDEARRQNVADVPSEQIITRNATDSESKPSLEFAAARATDARNAQLPLDLQIAAQSINMDIPPKSVVPPQNSSFVQSHTQVSGSAQLPLDLQIAAQSINMDIPTKSVVPPQKTQIHTQIISPQLSETPPNTNTKPHTPKKLSISIPKDMPGSAQAVYSGTKMQFDRSPSPALKHGDNASPERGSNNFRVVGSHRSRIHSSDGTPVSGLSVEEHHKYLQLVALAKSTPNLLTEADHSTMKRLKSRIDREVEAYRQYWFDVTKSRLTYLHETVSTAIERPLNSKRTEILKKYPRLWESSCSISLMRPPAKSPPVLQYKATLLRRGKACRFVPPKMDNPINLNSNFRSFWSTNEGKNDGVDASYWKKMKVPKVTEDPFVEPLVRENKPQVVISSSGITCFAALGIAYEGSWDIPIRITQETSNVSNVLSSSLVSPENPGQGKTVYIEKPLPKQALTARDRNRIYYSAAFESLCLDPKHRIPLVSTPNQAAVRTNERQGFQSPGLAMDFTRGDVEPLQLESPSTGDVATVKTSEVADGGKNATKKDDSEAFIYTVWEIGGISVLVRCKIHGMTSGDGGQVSAGFKVKLEYQWDRGPEVVTVEERSRWWTYAYIRGDTSIALGRVDVGTGVLVSVERLELSNLSRGPDWEAVHHHMLHYLLEKLCALPAGNYILSHTRGAEVLQLRRAVTDDPGSNKKPAADDLHALYSAPPAMDRTTIQYVPTEWVGPSDQVPSTFRPDVGGGNMGGKRGVFHGDPNHVPGVNYCRTHAASPGSCTWGEECRFPHITLSDAKQIAKIFKSPASSSYPSSPISPTTAEGLQASNIILGVKHSRERPKEDTEAVGMRERVIVKHCFSFLQGGSCERGEQCPFPHLSHEQVSAITKSAGVAKKTKKKKSQKAKKQLGGEGGLNVASGGSFFD